MCKKRGEAFLREMLTMFSNVTEVQLGILITQQLADPNIKVCYHVDGNDIAVELAEYRPSGSGLEPVADKVIHFLNENGVNATLFNKPKNYAIIYVPKDQAKNMLDVSMAGVESISNFPEETYH